jgi:endonuclease/exonuclease/phosphatase family metal-dependent hydrolase
MFATMVRNTIALALSLFAAGFASAETIRVMSFNLWHGGDAGKQPLEQTVAVIKASKADVVGLQETAGLAAAGANRPDNAAKIAKLLGWNYFDQGGYTAIISKFKIVGNTERKWGVTVELPSGKRIDVFNAHLAPAPYQPYQLLNIPYFGGKFLKTEAEAIAAARTARGGQVERLLGDVRPALLKDRPVFVTGDFNEPSHLDWTDAAATAKHCPIKVEWPTSKALADVKLVDAFRAVHSNPVERRGLTWTPTTKITDPKDRHDRIDFVYAGGKRYRIVSAHVVGESKEHADIVVTPYPSDHRAVLMEFQIAD